MKGAATDVPARRFRFDIAYDGTAYAGWQIQPRDSSVQARLQNELALLTGTPDPRLHGSGRTDRGVHARGQVAHADLIARMSPDAMRRALNARLPRDIRVLRVRTVAPDFHARRDALGKEYRYQVWNGPVMPPERRLYMAHVTRALDRESMQAAAELLVGEHDFSAFAANPNRDVPDPVRRIERFTVGGRGPTIIFRVFGNGFLYKMVRSMVGFLLRVGQGDEDPAAVAEVLAGRTRTARVPTAPPQGLFLWRVEY